jgi:hypothetical protein
MTPPRLVRRWVPVLAISIVSHWLLLSWSGLRVEAPLETAAREESILVTLPPPAQPEKAPGKSAATPAAQARQASAQSVRKVTTRRPRGAPVRPSTTVAASPVVDMAASPLPALKRNVTGNEAPYLPPADTSRAEALPAPDVVQAVPETPEVPAPAYRADPPPAAELRYDVQGLTNGQKTYGRGRITWQSGAGTYTVTGEAGILFFNVLEFASEGSIDDRGVAPELYREKRFRKPTTNTYFDREQNRITFSAVDVSYPRLGGEQDRASVVWQMVAIGRGSPETFRPGAMMELSVAAVRKFENWRLEIVGEEKIEVGTGVVHTWHVTREPRAGSDDQRIDIWLAPQNEWYPVQIRYTEPDGDFLNMSLSAVTAITAQ